MPGRRRVESASSRCADRRHLRTDWTARHFGRSYRIASLQRNRRVCVPPAATCACTRTSSICAAPIAPGLGSALAAATVTIVERNRAEKNAIGRIIWRDFLPLERLPGSIRATSAFRQKATRVIQESIVPSRYIKTMVREAPRARCGRYSNRWREGWSSSPRGDLASEKVSENVQTHANPRRALVPRNARRSGLCRRRTPTD